jgi:hypothetical protein
VARKPHYQWEPTAKFPAWITHCHKCQRHLESDGLVRNFPFHVCLHLPENPYNPTKLPLPIGGSTRRYTPYGY